MGILLISGWGRVAGRAAFTSTVGVEGSLVPDVMGHLGGSWERETSDLVNVLY